MSDLTRRNFVRSSAGAAAGIATIGTLGVADADAKQRATHGHPVVAWLGDPRDGSITIMAGDGQVTIHDHALAARISAHAKAAEREGRKRHRREHRRHR